MDQSAWTTGSGSQAGRGNDSAGTVAARSSRSRLDAGSAGGDRRKPIVSRAALRRLFCAGQIGAIESIELHLAGSQPRRPIFHHDACAVQPSLAGEAWGEDTRGIEGGREETRRRSAGFIQALVDAT